METTGKTSPPHSIAKLTGKSVPVNNSEQREK